MTRRLRTALASLFGVVAVIGLVGSTVGIRTNRGLFDSDRFAATIGDTLADPAVAASLTDYLSAEVVRVVPVASGVDTLVPDRLQQLAPTLSSRVTGTIDAELERLVHARIDKLLSDPAVRAHVVAAVRAAHAMMLHVIDTSGIANLSLADGTLTLNLLPVVVDALRALPPGRLSTRIELPHLAYGGAHADQLDQLSTALGVELPENLGLVEIYRGPASIRAGVVLSEVQRALVLFHKTLGAMAALTLVALVATVLVAPNRRHALMALAIGTTGAFAFAIAAIRRAVEEAAALPTSASPGRVVDTVLTALSHGLVGVLATGAVIAVVVWAGAAVVGVVSARHPRPGTLPAPVAAARRRMIATVLGFAAAAALVLADLTLATALSAGVCAVAAVSIAASAPPTRA